MIKYWLEMKVKWVNPVEQERGVREFPMPIRAKDIVDREEFFIEIIINHGRAEHDAADNRQVP